LTGFAIDGTAGAPLFEGSVLVLSVSFIVEEETKEEENTPVRLGHVILLVYKWDKDA
jgi:hypothetical protein